jgi:flavin-dependent dehydrogenase
MMQRWKRHPLISGLIEGGTLVKGGTKTIPEGGWWSRPQSHGEGFLILGDSGSLTNIARLKGIHTAVKSGQLAGEVLAEGLLEGDVSGKVLANYERNSAPRSSTRNCGRRATGARRSRRGSRSARFMPVRCGCSEARSSPIAFRSTAMPSR